MIISVVIAVVVATVIVALWVVSRNSSSSSVLAVHLGLVLLNDEGQRDVYLLPMAGPGCVGISRRFKEVCRLPTPEARGGSAADTRHKSPS